MLYLNFQSLSLDDFDSGSFALALNHFDIALQQPHPPGFPVYVGMGHLALALTGQPRTAMTLLSALMGTVAVVSLTWLGAEMGSWPGGLLAGLLLAFLPGFWLSAEMALSDVPGLALILLAVACLCRARRLSDLRWLAAGAFLGGLCLGLRPQDGIPVAIFGLYAVALSRGLKPPAQLVLAVVAALVGIALWFIPTVIATGGIGTYFDLLRTHSAHVLQIDSLFAQPVTLQSVAQRLNDFGSGLLALVGGSPILALVALLVVGIGLLRVRWRSAEALLLAAWLAIVAVQVFLLESLARPRLYLPFVPPLLLLAAMGWAGLTSPPGPLSQKTGEGEPVANRDPAPLSPTITGGKGLGDRGVVLLPLFLAGAFALTSLPLAAILTQQPTPPAQATAFIAAQYPPDKTLVVTMGSLRAAQIDLPNYAQLYLGQFDAASWAQTVSARNPTYVVLMDRDDVWPEAYDALTAGGEYVPVLDRVFQRDPRVFPQHSLIRLQVLTPVRLLAPADLALPADGSIAVGVVENGKYFGEGWYRAEDVAGSSARWTQQSAVIRVALPLKDTTLTLEATPYSADQTVEIVVNGQSLGTLPMSGIWQTITVKIPAGTIQGHAISTILLRHAHEQTPPGSNRVLAAAYRSVRFSS